MPIIAVTTWLFWDTLAPQTPVAATGLDVTALDLTGRVIGFSVSMVLALIHSYGLLGLAQTFAQGALGNALSAQSIAGFKRFTWTALALVPAKIAQQTFLILLVSLSDTASPGQIAVRIGSPEISAGFTAILLVFVAQVFVQGHAAEEENKAFL
ncbi:MAG: hypothetical protein AAF607_08915 [Pseudomonadota bacterium]